MKNRLLFNFFLIIGLCFAAPQTNAQLRINEVMQSNVHGIMDDLNEFPDSWVELYNADSQVVNLSEYALSVKDKASKAYKLPQMDVQPGQFVLVYCDKAANGLHADFRVDSGKGDLYLWKNGEIVETISLKKMPAPDVSYGRLDENSDVWGYQSYPTPRLSNCGRLVKDILPEPVFSTPGGLIISGLSLTLSIPSDAPQGTVIRYTLDGSHPTAASAQYTSPIDIKETTIVRAVLIADGLMSPLPTTHSYIFHPREQTLPVVSIAGDNSFFYDDKTGILVDGSYSSSQPNYEYDWRRPINLEYFETDGSNVINQVGETRVKGGATRVHPLKSLAIYANKRFVTKRFVHEFFHEDSPGIDTFSSFELRNAGNDFYRCYMRDLVMQRIFGTHVDMDWQPGQPVIIYINGVYKGIINLRPRSNEDYIEAYYDGLEDIHMFENWYDTKAGDIEALNDFQRFYRSSGHTFDEFAERMDVTEFINNFFSNIFFDNRDWPNNNSVLWRPMAEGGKWRWLSKDMDSGMREGCDKQPTLDWMLEINQTQRVGIELYNALLKLPEFRELFVNHAAVYMGDFLRPELMEKEIDRYVDMTAVEMPEHHKLYVSWYYDYNHEMEEIRKWTYLRVPYFYKHMAEHFGLNAPKPLLVTYPEGVQLTINDVKLTTEKFDGCWFPGRQLKIAAQYSQSDKAVQGWIVTTTNGGKEEQTTYDTPVLDITFPQAESVKVEPTIDPAGIDDIVGEDVQSTVIEWFDMQGRSLGTRKPANGIYLRKAGNTVTKVALSSSSN
ncbi:MAG: CotH kinase family protein [Muribaculaceae bacterium]|nr:CotH kinase family protein [Muribaculaceae bacterium]